MISHNKGSHPGALWKKCDFQIHTPRDHGWSGSPSLPGGDDQSEAKRAAWADDFVAACLDRGLAAIAVTDHHDHGFISYVQEAVGRLGEAATEAIWVFPGMEITCNDSCQCIVLFDADTGDAVISRLFSSSILRNVPAPDHTAPKTTHTEVCGCEVETVQVPRGRPNSK